MESVPSMNEESRSELYTKESLCGKPDNVDTKESETKESDTEVSEVEATDTSEPDSEKPEIEESDGSDIDGSEGRDSKKVESETKGALEMMTLK